ncbi:hypothetical protein Dthio_PD3538 [Desulfonatronospira thiodismutans ASO3-1]|uniref:Leucine rich repeat variant n=1 Tax=Desulfonatronospira thiodismutans ASO3-1 TaxID=555779 RepID=D6SN30_9BACT|nr:hypothetical protein [Desulfonatronospira thiodismutans]EFI36091.1 hypothetical protein Dthio_PD3538 [Desulfonatronospira thiodismutans ASO3-1]
MFDVRVTVNGKSVHLGYDAVEDIMFSIPDKKRFNNIIKEFAMSPVPQVRMEVASRSAINKEIIDILLEDIQIDVLRNLVSNHRAQRMIPESTLLRLVRTHDFEILETIAENIDQFSMCDPGIIAENICRSENPKVRDLLAENEFVGKKVLEILIHDDDKEIAVKARITLKRLEEEEELDPEDE